MRRLLLCLLVALSVAPVFAVATRAGAGGRSVEPFRRVGAWIDVFDYAPRLQNGGVASRVTPDSVSDMAALGVRTLYVQVANPDGAASDQLTDAAELRAILTQAHDHDMAVIPWFLPALTLPADDLAVMKQVIALRAGDERVDGIGFDLESTEVPDVALRNRRTVTFAR